MRICIPIRFITATLVALAVGIKLAARFELLNKDYGTRLQTSENTARLAGDVTPLRSVGNGQIRGQARTIKTFSKSAINQ